MVCPYCSSKTDVINSRRQVRNNQVWRRRRCNSCKSVFTTQEMVDLAKTFVVSRGNNTTSFQRDKLLIDVSSALRDSKARYTTAQEITATIIQNVLKNAPNGFILTETISAEAAKVLKRFDKQAYLRFVAEHTSLQV